MIKCCRGCQIDKPLEEFHKNHGMPDGHLNFCRACRREEAVRYYAENREDQLAKSAQWRAGNAEHKRANDAGYRARPGNAEKQRAYNTEYYKRNRERLIARTERYKLENPGLVRERGASYRTFNRERLREWHRENRIKNPEHVKRRDVLAVALRRARQNDALIIPFTTEQLKAKCAFWNNACWVCGEPATAIDHVKPVARGGGHLLSNLRPICKSCNSAKNAKWPLPSRAKIIGVV